ncbi:MAG: T9SS type A sorting domain-containing protein, partial [Bacteroidota bacterium]
KNCGTMQYLEQQMKEDPSLAQRLVEYEQGLQKWVMEHKDNLNPSRAVVTIPVVVHVVYNTAAQNISDIKIKEQIDLINRDFRKLNPDIVNVPSVWQGVAADCEIQFCLAQKDPSGNPTTGIERKQTTVVSFSGDDAVKYSNRGGLDAWDINKYFNIWVCPLVGSLAGYAQFPAQFNNNYGVVIKSDCFGDNVNVNQGRSLTHEIGHCFNLIHIWGDEDACSGSDGCNDTPNQAKASKGHPAFPKTDACSPNTPGIMFMNYMDYVYDNSMYMFTNNQKARVWAVLNSTLSTLTTSDACQSIVAPIANFSASSTTAVVGFPVQFNNLSTYSQTSWSWSFPGGNPSTSTVQNPIVTYNTVGQYNVSLTATNTAGNNTATKTNYINVINYLTRCDTISNIGATDNLTYYRVSATGGFISGNNSFGDKAKADYFNKAQLMGMDKISGAIFKLAKATGTGPDIKFSVWQETNGMPGTELGNKQVPLATIASAFQSSDTYFVDFNPDITLPSNGGIFVGVNLPPNSSDDTIALKSNLNGQSDPSTAWEQQGDNSWYRFDDCATSWVKTLSLAVYPILCPSGVGVTENSNDMNQISVFPNPVTNNVTLMFADKITNKIKVNICNIVGEIISTVEKGNLATNTLQLDMSSFANGIYYLNIQTDKISVTKKVVLIK